MKHLSKFKPDDQYNHISAHINSMQGETKDTGMQSEPSYILEKLESKHQYLHTESLILKKRIEQMHAMAREIKANITLNKL